ncbi:MAG: hypothetical protein WD070_04995 [Pirellulaceae bacterium]
MLLAGAQQDNAYCEIELGPTIVYRPAEGAGALSQCLLNEGNRMTTVDEIIAAAERLTPAQFVRLRQRLDRLEKKLWDNELSHMDGKMKQVALTDEDIDQMVTRRRRESRR